MPPSDFDTCRDDFHAHLDVCAQCRNHPLDMCEVGAGLLVRAVEAPGVDLPAVSGRETARD